MSAKARLLFVDDEQDILDLLALTFGDFDVETALNADAALKLLRTKAFDVLVTDIRMPGASGLSLIASATEHCPGILVFVMTGHHQRMPHEAQNKVIRWILKPFSVAAIRGSIIEALEARQTVVNG